MSLLGTGHRYVDACIVLEGTDVVNLFKWKSTQSPGGALAGAHFVCCKNLGFSWRNGVLWLGAFPLAQCEKEPLHSLPRHERK